MSRGYIPQRSTLSLCVLKVRLWVLHLIGRSTIWVRSCLDLPSHTESDLSVVEITPIGIQSLQWKFYIIWTVFNASFVPIVYLFYPETSDRTLEDIDRLFRDNQDIFIFKDKDAISTKRPLAYIEHEQAEVSGRTLLPKILHKSMKSLGLVGVIEHEHLLT